MDCEANNKVGGGQGWGQSGSLGGPCWPLSPFFPPGGPWRVGDAVLLPQDLICVLIDDGGFLVLSNQEDHWYQVSAAAPKTLLLVCMMPAGS